jgi:hypothetical protein
MIYNFIKINNTFLKVGIYSVYFPNNDPRYREIQQKIFNHYNYYINQIEWAGDLSYDSHPNFMNWICETEDVDYFIFFDIDAFPIRKEAIMILLNRIYGKDAILGIEQRAGHISDHIYAGPACFLISKEFYKKLGNPKFNANHRGDVGQELTHLCQEKNYEVMFIKFKSCEIERWDLKDDVMFGTGSVYEDLVFHNFNSSDASTIDVLINYANKLLPMKLIDFVDRAYYINLFYKTDRNEETIKELKKYNLQDFIFRSEAVAAFNGTIECSYGSPEWIKCVDGCSQSHLRIIKNAKEKGFEKILIFEDDIFFYDDGLSSPMTKIEKSIEQISQLNDDWEILYLGGGLLDNEITMFDKNLIFVNGMNGSHAYILNHTAYDKIIEGYHYGLPMDILLSSTLKLKYSVFPIAVTQRGGDKSDIGGHNSFGASGFINSYQKPISNLDKFV